jgi:hypothetical protein
MTRIDREALRRAVEVASAQSEARRQQIEEMLKERDWEEVALFAAYSAQNHALSLRPWQTPPCEVYDIDEALRQPRDDQRGEHRAAVLLQRLQDAGLSRFEPDPIGALERVQVLLP